MTVVKIDLKPACIPTPTQRAENHVKSTTRTSSTRHPAFPSSNASSSTMANAPGMLLRTRNHPRVISRAPPTLCAPPPPRPAPLPPAFWRFLRAATSGGTLGEGAVQDWSVERGWAGEDGVGAGKEEEVVVVHGGGAAAWLDRCAAALREGVPGSGPVVGCRKAGGGALDCGIGELVRSRASQWDAEKGSRSAVRLTFRGEGEKYDRMSLDGVFSDALGVRRFAGVVPFLGVDGAGEDSSDMYETSVAVPLLF